MAINVQVDGVTYKGITMINVGGKTIKLMLDSDVSVWNINQNLTHVSSSNLISYVTKGSGAGFSTTLTAHNGYDLQTVVVTMGDSDITQTAYSNGVVSIPQVTGNVSIVATAVEGGVLYTLDNPIVATTRNADNVVDTGIKLFPSDTDRSFVMKFHVTGSYTADNNSPEVFMSAPEYQENSSHTISITSDTNTYALGSPRPIRMILRSSSGQNIPKALGTITPISADDEFRVVVTYDSTTRTFKGQLSSKIGSASPVLETAQTHTVSETFVAGSANMVIGGKGRANTAALENATISDFTVYDYVLDDDAVEAYLLGQ